VAVVEGRMLMASDRNLKLVQVARSILTAEEIFADLEGISSL
jgi:hypothetical protein